ncbi:MAG: phosphomannomutase/phosphoglucomutase [Planctomycetota bacterium]
MISKIFKAYDVRATYPEPLGPDEAWKVGHASATFLQRSAGNFGPPVGKMDTMVVGRDMRPHSPELAKALIDGIRSTGMKVIDIGMIDTSCIYFAINHYDAVGGIQTTASHNPVEYNGFKISGPRAKPIGSATGLKDIERIAGQLSARAETGTNGDVAEEDVWPAYREHVLQFLDLKKPVRVIVDASNGMAGVMVPKVFGGVENLTIDEINFETGVAFVHDPNPLVEENLQQLKEATKSTDGVDAGLCFDGDADRCMFIDEQANTIGCDILTAIVSRDFLKQPGNEGSAIVYDLRSSHALAEEIEQAGGKPVRERVGHVFMKKALADSGGVFGGELSGHFYFRDNFNADSGAIAFARVLSILSATDTKLSGMAGPIDRFHQSGELNFQVEDKDGMIKQLADKYKQHEVDYLDGITVDAKAEGWWFNVRKSNTEPMLRLNLEAKEPSALKQKLAELKGLMGEPVAGH